MADKLMAFYHSFQTAAVATGTGTAMDVGGLPAVGVQITGISGDTITFQGTIDGTNWVAVQAVNLNDGGVGTTATANGLYLVPVTGLDELRCNITIWSAGTITVIGKGVVNAAGVTLADIDIVGQEDMNVAQVGGETVTADQTGRMPVSLYGKSSAAGDKEVLLDSTGHPQVDVMDISKGTQTSDVKVTLDEEAITSSGTTIALTPTITGGAYSAGDAVGGLLTFTNAALASGGGGVIKGVVIIDDAGQDAELELWLFNQTFTAMSDNAAWAPSEADLENCIGIISTQESSEGWLAAGTPSVIDIEVARRYDLTGTSLFGQLVTRGTPTFAATDDVSIKVCLLED